MKRMIDLGEDLISSKTPLRRRSNSPLTEAPASRRPMSRLSRVVSFSVCGTSPSLMRRASPSMTAVLPTPGSPTRMGLFLRLLARMATIWRIS